MLTGDRAIYRADGENVATLWLYGKVPLRIWSKVAGAITNLPLPVFMRSTVYGTYSTIFGVNMEDAIEEGAPTHLFNRITTVILISANFFAKFHYPLLKLNSIELIL